MDIKQKILGLKLPENSFIVVGSGILNALGIRESNDIDMIVTQDVFDSLECAGWEHDTWADQTVLKNDVFDLGLHWMNVKIEKLLQRATVVEGIPYLSLSDLLSWKIERARPKDILDIELINDYIAKKPS